MVVKRSIAVVIPAYGPSPHLRAVLEGVRAQSRKPDAIYVSHSGSHDPSEWIAREFPEVRALHSQERLYAGAARNRAARMAETDILAFTDCDTVPNPDWLEHAEQTLEKHPDGFVVGSVGVANTGGYWGMTTWLCEFSEQAPWRPAGVQTGGASCNMAVWAAHLREVDYFPEGFRAGQDTMLLYRLRNSGHEQRFVSKMSVGHFNIAGFGHMSKHLLNQGRHFAKVRLSADLPGRNAVRFWPMAPLLGVAKGARVFARMLGNSQIGKTLYYGPGIVVGLTIWTAGCVYASATQKFVGDY